MVEFEKKVLEYIEENQLIRKEDRLLIACSGGIDSMALLHFFANVQQKLNVKIFAAHVDHMLRGEISFLDRQFVESYCQKREIPIFSTSINIPKILEEEGGNSQAICRRERYLFFDEMMKQHSINKLVTAHHADDQLETLLMAITKSGNINALKGMQPIRKVKHGELIRPFLSVTKDEIFEYLKKNNIPYREDASNEKDDYTRNRFRHHVIPFLKTENPKISMNAVQITKNIQQDDELLMQYAMDRFPYIVKKNQHNFYSLNINQFQKEPVALQRRIILILLNYLSDNEHFVETSVITSSILKLCQSKEGNASVYLPNGFIANRQYDTIVFINKQQKEKAPETIRIPLNEWTDLNFGIRLYIGDSSNVINTFFSHIFYFSSDNFPPPFTIRSRKEGDRILIKGMDQPKRLSRLFIDEKIPLEYRDEWPILTDGNGEILSVLTLRVHHHLSKIKKEQHDLMLIVEKSKNMLH